MLNKCRKIIGKIYTVLTTKPCIWVLRKDGFKCGANFDVQNYVSIDISHCFLIEVGDNVAMAPGSMISAHDASTKAHLGYTKIGRVLIGDRVFIDAKAIILLKVKIGNNVIVGAGSVVSKDVPDNVVVAGVPAKVIMKTSDYLVKYSKETLGNRVFDSSYTFAGGITEQKKDEIRKSLGSNWGGVQ